MRKVAIVARAGTSSLAPWQDTSWEIWGIPWIEYPRVDRMFEVHEQQCLDDCENEFYKYSKWVPAFNEKYPDTPVYCFESRACQFNHPVSYPLDEVTEFLPRAYLENSIAYMLALALHEGVDEIGLWGVHMLGSEELFYEKPSITYLIGLAEGMGVKVTIADGSPLMMSYFTEGRYGVRSAPEFKRKFFLPIIPKYSDRTQKIKEEP